MPVPSVGLFPSGRITSSAPYTGLPFLGSGDTGAPTANVNAPPGTLTPASPTDWTPQSGGKPWVPDPGRTARDATRGNLRLLPRLRNLGGQVNQFNLNQRRNQVELSVPGLRGLEAQSAGNIGAALRGELPGDVINQILTNAAEFGVSSGTGGGGRDIANIAPGTLSGHMGLRSLGLSSLDQTRWGEGALAGAINRAPSVPLYDISGNFVSPEQQQQASYLANVIASAPTPAAAAQYAIQLANAGMTRGFGSVPAATPPAGGGGGGSAPSSTTTMLSDLINRYLGNLGGAPGRTTPGAAAPPPPAATTAATPLPPAPVTTPPPYTLGPGNQIYESVRTPGGGGMSVPLYV